MARFPRHSNSAQQSLSYASVSQILRFPRSRLELLEAVAHPVASRQSEIIQRKNFRRNSRPSGLIAATLDSRSVARGRITRDRKGHIINGWSHSGSRSRSAAQDHGMIDALSVNDASELDKRLEPVSQ